MSNQLIKKNPAEGYQNVFPKTFIDAIKDRESGASLEEILQGFNMYFLSYNGSKALTRCQVPYSIRKEGFWITYVLYDHTVVTEWYNSDQIDDNSWSMDSNWRVASNMLVGDISVSVDGYWVINGEKTEAKAQGEQGVTPLLRIGANNKLQVSYNAGKAWKDISDYIVPRFRYIRGTTNDTAGIIQISMDLGKTWTDLSNEITNNFRISRYIGINESLPTSGIAEGTVYMKGPYYDENDTSNSNPIYRMWVYAWKDNNLAWQDNGEFTSISAGIVQEKGNSTTEVMSQDAVTRELTELELETKMNVSSLQDRSMDRIKEDGFAVCDKHGNVIMRFDKNGLDAAALGATIKQLVKEHILPEVAENGFHICDAHGNTILKLDDRGLDVAALGKNLERIIRDSTIPEVAEKGFYICDTDGNIIFSIDKKGLDVSTISPNLKNKIQETLMQEVSEEGLSFCDSNGNIGARLDNLGLISVTNSNSIPKPSSIIRIDLQVSDELPTAKGTIINGCIKVNIDGNVIFKYATLEVQGSSSAAYPKKNWTFGFFNDSEYSSEYEWRLNNMPLHSEYVWKANWIDATHSRNIISNRIWEQIVRSRDIFPQRETDVAYSSDMSALERFTDGALGHVDGFPSILYINNEFYGIGCLNIGKKRQNYNLDSKNQSNIQMAADDHCSFTTYNESTWEIRNPKSPDEDFVNKITAWFESNKLSGESFKSQFSVTHNLSNAIDYYIFIEMLKADDCVDKNFLLTSWDGVQYAFMPYDLDTTFGLWWDGSQLVSAEGSVLDSTNNLTSSSVTFWRKFKDTYVNEIKERYTMLRQNVISVGNISNMLHNFMAVFGLENFEKEAEKWPTIPSNTSIQTSLSQIMKWVSDRLTYLDTMFNL